MSKSKLKQRLSHGTGPSASAVPCWGNAFALRCLVGWTSLEILGILRSEKNDRNCHVFPTVEALGYLGLKPRKKKLVSSGLIRFHEAYEDWRVHMDMKTILKLIEIRFFGAEVTIQQDFTWPPFTGTRPTGRSMVLEDESQHVPNIDHPVM